MRRETFPTESERVALETRQDRQRANVTVLAEARFGSQPWRKARLDDLSTTGFRIGWVAQPGPGQKIFIRIAGLEALAAEIAWRDGAEMGCKFAQPLSVYVFEHLVRQASTRS